MGMLLLRTGTADPITKERAFTDDPQPPPSSSSTNARVAWPGPASRPVFRVAALRYGRITASLEAY
jgi:hypothetical protein